MSTLETIVAVAVMSIALVPLLDVQMETTRAHARLEAGYRRSTMERNSLVILRDINPMEQQQGELQLAPDVSLVWEAHPLTSERRSLRYPSGRGQFMVALYRLDVSIIDDAAHSTTRFSLERLGWRRSPDEE